MHKKLLDITSTIDDAARSLQTKYGRKQLYALRVGIRRCRSILKHIDSHRSRSFRKTWGGFAATTNDARDWDVFLLKCKKLLSPGELDEFRMLNGEAIRSSHEAAIEMLGSPPWKRHLEDWRHYLALAEEDVTGNEHLEASLQSALSKARQALASAQSEGGDRLWHKFRIAVKDVRYVADTGRDDPQHGKSLRQVARQCRELQTLLGDWHDTVVQLGILEELPPAAVHDQLGELIRHQKDDCLADIHAALDNHPLFPDATL